jgi:actin related protein 2/3 complex subunit 1A/1B
MIKKKFKSTVLCCAFHPTNGQLLATGCADFKCRVFSTFAADVDGTNVDAGPFAAGPGPQEFGESYCELGSLGWIHAVAWSPSGNSLAYAGHDSTFHVAILSANPVVRSVRLQSLPMNCLSFVSESAILAGGHDFSPQLFVCKGGEWNFFDTVDKPDLIVASEATSGASAARELFKNKTVRGQDTKGDSDGLKTRHESAITCLQRVGPSKFSTSGLDGKFIIWDLPALEISMATLGL